MDITEKMKLGRTYAGIFLTRGMGESEILILAAEMQFISDSMRDNTHVEEFFASPAIPRKERIQSVGTFAEKGGFSPYTRRLLEILAERGRGDILPYVSRELHFIADRILNRIRVRMTTAVEPSVSEIEGLSKRIGRFFEKNVFVERASDPSIIGGFILEGDGKMVDLSIKGQIHRALLDI